MNCTFCGCHVGETDSSTWHQQTVWVSGPKRHGATLAESTGKAACDPCVQKLKAGHAPDQPAMEF